MLNHSLMLISLRWFDVLDILLVAFLIYQLYYLLRGTVAIRIFLGVASIYLIWKIVEAFQMKMLGEILGQFIGVGVIALIIVFQQELRRFLLLIGNTDFIMKSKNKGLLRFFISEDNSPKVNSDELCLAINKLAKTKTGALIVITNKTDPSLYVLHGEPINADLSAKLLISIFQKESPLHDGAVLIDRNKIKKAGCVLPVSESGVLPAHVGMRHRSAVGISEKTDVLVIVTSEETGTISTVNNGELQSDISIDQLKVIIKEVLG
jgi:diadenylate cyclase